MVNGAKENGPYVQFSLPKMDSPVMAVKLINIPSSDVPFFLRVTNYRSKEKSNQIFKQKFRHRFGSNRVQ